MKNICFIKTIMNGMKRFRSKNAQRQQQTREGNFLHLFQDTDKNTQAASHILTLNNFE